MNARREHSFGENVYQVCGYIDLNWKYSMREATA